MKNVTLDFTVIQSMDPIKQDLAVMPANLAKKLLKEYAKKLQLATVYTVVEPLADSLNRISREGTVEEAIQACLEFVQERNLIDCCAKEEWSNFAVNTAPKPIPLDSM